MRAAIRCAGVLAALLCSPVVAHAGAREAPTAPVAVSDAVIELLDGRVRRLADLWGESPLLVTLYYTRCSGVCTPYLLSLGEAERAFGRVPADYRILALSFDAQDGLSQVRAYADGLGLNGRPRWSFGLAAPEVIDGLAAAFGFWYRLDAGREQYDHPAMTGVVIDGRVRRVLQGHPVNPRAFRELMWELQGRFVPAYTIPGRETLLGCLQYDPVTGRARLDWGLLLLALPGTAALALSALVFGRARRRPLPGSGQHRIIPRAAH